MVDSTKSKLDEAKEKANEFAESVKEVGEKFLELVGAVWVLDKIKEGFSEIGEYVKEATALAEDHEQVLARLNVAWSTQPHLAKEGQAGWTEATEKVEELAEHLEKVGVFSKKISEDAATRLGVMGFTPEGIQKLLPLLEGAEVRMGHIHATAEMLEGDAAKFTGRCQPVPCARPRRWWWFSTTPKKKHLKGIKDLNERTQHSSRQWG